MYIYVLETLDKISFDGLCEDPRVMLEEKKKKQDSRPEQQQYFLDVTATYNTHLNGYRRNLKSLHVAAQGEQSHGGTHCIGFPLTTRVVISCGERA